MTTNSNSSENNSASTPKVYPGQIEIALDKALIDSLSSENFNAIKIIQKLFKVHIDPVKNNSNALTIRPGTTNTQNTEYNRNLVSFAKDLVELSAKKVKANEKVDGAYLKDKAIEISEKDAFSKNTVWNSVQANTEFDIRIPTNALADTLFTVNGFVLEVLKKHYNISLKRSKTRMTVTDKSYSFNTGKLKEVEKIIRDVISIQEKNQPVSEKHVNEMIHGKKPSTNIIKMNTTTLKEITNNKKIDTKRTNLDLVHADATLALFSTHKSFLKDAQKLIGFKAEIKDKSVVTVMPEDSSGRKEEKELVISQATDILNLFITKISNKHAITPKLLAENALRISKDQSNEKKIGNRVRDYLSKHPENSLGKTKKEKNEFPLIDQLSRVEVTQSRLTIESGKFGSELYESEEVQALLKEKLGVVIGYYGAEKRITIEKLKNSKTDISIAESVILYAHSQYEKDVQSLAPTYLSNVVDNALDGKPFDFVPKEKSTEMKLAERREKYKIQTFNKTGENRLMYPKTDSQYELYNEFFGKPSNDIEKSFNKHGKKIIFAIGPAASGKTSWATFMGVMAFKLGLIKHLVLVRPMVSAGDSRNASAALPGGIKEKTAPTLMPIYENLLKVMPDDEIARFIKEATAPGSTKPVDVGTVKKFNDGRTIEIARLEELRGRTFEDALLIGDEMQNGTEEQMKMFLTRLGRGSRAYVSLDMAQIDLPNKLDSSAPNTIMVMHEAHQRGQAKNIAMVACNGNLRDKVVTEILDAWATFENNGIEVTEDNRDKTVEDYYKIARIFTGRDEMDENHQFIKNSKGMLKSHRGGRQNEMMMEMATVITKAITNAINQNNQVNDGPKAEIA